MKLKQLLLLLGAALLMSQISACQDPCKQYWMELGYTQAQADSMCQNPTSSPTDQPGVEDPTPTMVPTPTQTVTPSPTAIPTPTVAPTPVPTPTVAPTPTATSCSITNDGVEICDGLDNDCDGHVDDEDPDVQVQYPWLEDADGDSFGSGVRYDGPPTCEMPEGYVPINGDCDDTDPAVNPAMQEACDGVDTDCDDYTERTCGIGDRPLIDIGDVDGRGASDVFALIDGKAIVVSHGDEQHYTIGFIFFGEEMVVGEAVNARNGVPVITSDPFDEDDGFTANVKPLGNVIGGPEADFMLDLANAADDTLSYLIAGGQIGGDVTLPDDATARVVDTGNYATVITAHGDLDGDGKQDLLFYTADHAQYQTYRYCLLSDLAALSGTVNLTTEAQWCFTITESGQANAGQPRIGDFNGDGSDDIAIHLRHEDDQNDYRVHFYFGPFTEAPSYQSRDIRMSIDDSYWYAPLQAGDFNGDGVTDLLRQITGPVLAFDETADEFLSHEILYGPFSDEAGATATLELLTAPPHGVEQGSEFSELSAHISQWGFLFQQGVERPWTAALHQFPLVSKAEQIYIGGGSASDEWQLTSEAQWLPSGILADVNNDQAPEVLFGDPTHNNGMGTFTPQVVPSFQP